MEEAIEDVEEWVRVAAETQGAAGASHDTGILHGEGESVEASEEPRRPLDIFAVMKARDSTKKSARKAGVRRSKSRCCPECKRVEGTRAVVDAFTFQSDYHAAYFLTHFHSDHYVGLRPTFQGAPIYCSEITAKLVIQELRVPPQHIRSLPMNERVEITEPSGGHYSVTLLDANHCPGAVLLLFEVAGEYHLHTGDMRYHRRMQSYRELRGIRVENLYLDTTYADSNYDFPLQEEAIQEMLDIMESERKSAVNPVFLIGSYTIGKERLFIAAAKKFQTKVYVSPSKYSKLRHLDFDTSILTTDPAKAWIHVVKMWDLNFQKVSVLYGCLKERHDKLVGFKPTGWTHGSRQKGAKRMLTRGNHLAVYNIPYSEHSSVNELREFVAWLKPRRILPTVGGGSREKIERLVEEVRKPKKEKKAPTTLERFFSRLPSNSDYDRKACGEDVNAAVGGEFDLGVAAMELEEADMTTYEETVKEDDIEEQEVECALWEYRAELLFQSSQELSQASKTCTDTSDEDFGDDDGVITSASATLWPAARGVRFPSGETMGRDVERAGELARSEDDIARKVSGSIPSRDQRAKKEVVKKPWKQRDAVRGKPVMPDLPKIVRGKTSVLSFFQAWARPNFGPQ